MKRYSPLADMVESKVGEYIKLKDVKSALILAGPVQGDLDDEKSAAYVDAQQRVIRLIERYLEDK